MYAPMPPLLINYRLVPSPKESLAIQKQFKDFRCTQPYGSIICVILDAWYAISTSIKT
jgi:hypothetical protein